MSQEIEIEYKILLTAAQFEELASTLPFPKQAIKQTNHYFETANFALKAARSALRIRKKDTVYTLTLKEPYGAHILETHDVLDEADFTAWINGNPQSTPHVGPRLQALGIEIEKLVYFGALVTERKSYTTNGIEYVLDKSMYHNLTDYELEIEAPSSEEGIQAFHKILEDFSIIWQEPVTKIERFFQAKDA